MIKLHQYPGIWGLPSLSPFCTKVEVFLRLAALPYRIIWQNNPSKGPKGKFPVLEDEDKVIADSSFIIDYLSDKYAPQFACDDGIALAMQRMIEEHLYFVMLYSRWIDPEGFKLISAAFAPFFPKPLASMALLLIKRRLHKQAWMQGMARHSCDEIYARGVRDLQAIDQWLKDKPYCLGTEVKAIDATVFAFLLTIQLTPLDNAIKRAASTKNLISYSNRMSNLVFGQEAGCQRAISNT